MPEIVNVEETATPTPTPLAKQMREEAESNLVEYIRSLAGEEPVKVTVIRELPRTWQGRNIEGTLDSFEEPISEDDIREMFGGGRYKLTIYTPDERGSWTYRKSVKKKIAGDPKVDGLITTGGGGNSSEDSPSVVKDAMNMAREHAARAERRAEAERERASLSTGRPDPALQMAMDEMKAARKEAADTNRRMLELVTQKNDNPLEKLLGSAIEGESARMQALQVRIDSEMRQRADMHRAEIDRLHQRYEDIARRQEDSHKREIDNLRQSHELSTSTLKTSYDGQIKGLEREIKALEREVSGSKQEVIELRGRKEKSIIETLGEVAAVKEALEGFGGSGDKEEGSPWERIIGGIMGSPLAEGVAQRLAGGPAAVGASLPARQEEVEMDVPIGKPVQLPDGRIIVRRPDGTVVQLQRKAARPMPASGEEAPIEIPDDDLQVAVGFMESALVADTDPAEFARAARHLAPQLTTGPVQQLLKTQGIDAFLAHVARVSPGSPLLSQHGKNWARKVAAALIE